MIKLQKGTWRQYTRIWKALLCFVYRTQQNDTSLSHRLTPRQLCNLDEAVKYANRHAQLCRASPTTSEQTTVLLEQSTDVLDHHCLELCISLLDHTLKGDVHESVVVGFLAVLGIDANKQTLKEAYHYTPSLSGFIKIAQMLVIQKALVRAGDSGISQPADLLDEMRARFLLHETRSPFSWANRLRTYGKRIRDSTTCLGFISWSDNDQSLSYRGIEHLSMEKFRDFARDQVNSAQTQLEDLLMLHPNESRKDLGVEFWMHQIVDNAAENASEWNFLCHPQNQQGTLPCRDNWLLERVLRNDWLRDEFICAGSTAKQVRWKRKAVEAYRRQVDAFLERLLLLVHLTSGQPARGTEVLSLRHVNTISGHHRNVFIDNGMVSTVTEWHKGYSITGSTKIIHRYLPKEVGELLIYYLWLIQPFHRKLRLLALGKEECFSPFLWTRQGSTEPWESSKLATVLKRETQQAFGIGFTIPVYRHLAIAISRKHLTCRGFKRDYGQEETNFDLQAAHTPFTSGAIYARGFDEAPGHIEARRSEYRKVSQEWHRFLGFLPSSLPSRKRPLGDITNHDGSGVKRARFMAGPIKSQEQQQEEQDDMWEF
jgi:hypothetical protein